MATPRDRNWEQRDVWATPISCFPVPATDPAVMEQIPMWSPTPIIGYRAWVVRGGSVTGLTGYRWEDPTITAVCRRRSGTGPPGAPHLDADNRCPGRCGVNAYRTPEALLAAGGPRGKRAVQQLNLSGALYGAVAMWGKVVEHEDGYRAEHARAIGLVVVNGDRVVTTTDPTRIGQLFRNPGQPLRGWDAGRADRRIRSTIVHELGRMADETGK